MSEQKVTVIIADDHPLFRKGLKEVLEQSGRFQLLAEASDGAEALRIIEKYRPDIAVLDIQMPEMDGFQVAHAMQEKGLNSSVVYLTMYQEDRIVKKAFDTGMSGYILKENAAIEIINCLTAVSEGKYYLTSSLSDYLMRSKRKTQHPELENLKSLTDTEKNILCLFGEVKTAREIADQLFISVKTVNNHRNNICKKLNLNGSYALIKYAVEHKDLLQG